MDTALVTGAARGIGRAIAARLAARGFSVVAADIDGELAADAATAWRGQGWHAEGAALDVTDRAAVCALFDRIGPVGVVVNNAGVAAALQGIAALTQADYRRVFAVNVQGVFIVAQEAARRMRKGGRIINIASRGYLGGAGASHVLGA